MNTINGLKDVLESHKVGDEVRVTYIRDDEVREARVKLQYIN